MDPSEHWPLWRLSLRTPRLQLRPDDDAGLCELADEAHRGVHDPDDMPFLYPWTDAPAEELSRNLLAHHWKLRAAVSPASWTVCFLVRLNGRVIGAQSIDASDFATTREIHTGSWLGRRHQGNGYGTEMRAAVLLWAFDHLGADQARSDAFTDNAASRAVSDRLGYVADGSARYPRRDRRAEVDRLRLTPDRFVRPEWDLRVAGMDGCPRLLVGAP